MPRLSFVFVIRVAIDVQSFSNLILLYYNIRITQLESSCTPFFPTTYVEVIDNTGEHSCDNGAKLEVLVVSDQFDNVALLKRHRLVNDVLTDLMPQIHALSMKTWTTKQYEAKQQEVK